jgi:hypothetical protein
MTEETSKPTQGPANENLSEILKKANIDSGNLASLDKLLMIVLTTPNLHVDEKIKLLNELRKLKPPTSDRWIYRWVIWFLGATIIITVSVSLLMAFKGKAGIPDGLLAIASAAVGALASFLSPLSKSVSR